MPTSSNLPLPLKYIDVYRITHTNLPSFSEARVEDFWTEGEIELSDTWTGSTTFSFCRPRPEPGWEWVANRMTKIQKSSRPPNVWPEIWTCMSAKSKKKAQDDWKDLLPNFKEARTSAGILSGSGSNAIIRDEDLDDFLQILARLRLQYGDPVAPAMPVLPASAPAASMITSVLDDPVLAAEASTQHHLRDLWDDLWAKRDTDASEITISDINHTPSPHHPKPEAGFVSHHWFQCVHTPVKPKDISRIPEARNAVEKNGQNSGIMAHGN